MTPFHFSTSRDVSSGHAVFINTHRHYSEQTAQIPTKQDPDLREVPGTIVGQRSLGKLGWRGKGFSGESFRVTCFYTKGFSMLAIGAQDAVNLLRFFDDLPDPRSNVNRLHRLGDVIVMAICAVVANADGPTAIAQWAKLNDAWLRRHLALPSGIPGKDTFRRVLGLLPPAAFQQCFQQWLQTLQTSADEDSENKKHIAIDGKTLRRSHDRQHGLGPMHIVSAWASDFGITLGQVAATSVKSTQKGARREELQEGEKAGKGSHLRPKE